MTRTWRFSEAGFSVLWKDRTGDRLPAPFLYTSTAATQAEYRAEQEDARNRMLANLDHEVTDIVDVVSSPDLYLTVRGGGRSDPAALIRMRAARRDGRGYLITQLPGDSIYHRGGYTVTACDPVLLADAIVAALPTTEPGSGGDIDLPSADEDFDRTDVRSPVAVRDDTVHARAARFSRAVPSRSGQIRISQGSSVFGPRGIQQHSVLWRDLEHDGRYVITDRPATALAADNSRFIRVLNSRITRVIEAIKEEREQIC